MKKNKARATSMLLATLAAAGTTTLVFYNQASAATEQPAYETVKPDARAAALVPPAIRAKGTITLVMTTSSPPAHFTTEQGMKGLDHDMAVAVAKALNLKPNVVGVPLDQVIPGLQAHRYDAVVSQFKATPARAKVLDFIDYAQSGTVLGALAGNPKHLSPDNLCGIKIGVQKGSSQAVGTIPVLSKKCTDQGKKPIAESTFADSTTALLAMRSHRIDGVLIDLPVMGYAAKQSKEVMIVGTPISTNAVGIGVVKNSNLAAPIQSALQYLHDSGTYQKIFDAWGMQHDEISEFKINNVVK